MTIEKKILLETGTNELEIIEFQIEAKEPDGRITSTTYGINVGKVREIIKRPDAITDVAKSHPAVEGIFNFRGTIVSVINLPRWLGKETDDVSLNRIILTEFNKTSTGFLVNSVSRIHRIGWDRVESPSSVITSAESECITGIIKFEDKILMLIDFEKILADVNPTTVVTEHAGEATDVNRGKTILILEDSGIIMKIISKSILDAGFKVLSATNGEDGLRIINQYTQKAQSEGKSLYDYIQIVISDIEMPKMDGLHFLKRVKEEGLTTRMPVILFSSMATPDNIKKWGRMGAAELISKPDVSILLDAINRHIL